MIVATSLMYFRSLELRLVSRINLQEGVNKI